ncbi:Arginyl-tRNA synthetase [Baffinella frigidus]|nr:Arginyl-tRNA synthetase [Cryptophyta sp. CCMP2293]
MVTQATKPEFGDYQCNAALPLSKLLSKKPREVAEALLAELAPVLAETFEAPEIAGPGFLNLRFKNSYVESRVAAMLASAERCGIPKTATPQRVVVDFSSPNIAKEMHVGHLRSTIIGDTICRLEEFLGHDVVRLNHVGDWGTQFGMLITYLREQGYTDAKSLEGLEISDLVTFYKKAKGKFDEDPVFQDTSRKEVVALQGGNAFSLAAWEVLCGSSRKEFQQIYDLLDIRLQERGESFYNAFLPAVVADLKTAGLLETSEGAQVVFIDGAKNKDGDRMPLLVQKTDGGYMYSTTDLAAIRQRVVDEKAERVLYVTDSGQAGHFAQVFQVARRAGWTGEAALQHVPFGLVQGEDGKKFATRSGETVKLRDLLDEAVKIATEDMKTRFLTEGKDWDQEAIDTARVVGLSAVKYADLSMNRESNYRFSYKKMLALSGNTAPYMLYAVARINGIRRKIGQSEKVPSSLDIADGAATVTLAHPAEITLARHLLVLPELLQEVEQSLYPHRLCDYIFELSQRFNQFYENCPVANAATPEEKASRVALCDATAATLELVMGILGIKTVDRL